MATIEAAGQKLRRWTKLRYHAIQHAFFTSQSRRIMCPAGRRSGKTEIAKRRTVIRAGACTFEDGWFVCSAPTREQAKRIYWRDLLALTPANWIARVYKSDLSIELKWGPRIQVLGMDAPERMEGAPLDHITMDEYGSMHPETWHEHVQPALSTVDRPGTAVFLGAPEGRNHYWDLWCRALDDASWSCFHWPSWDIIDAEIIEQARRELDERTFSQEYGGQFIDFKGRAYYPFDRELHAQEALSFDPARDVIFCFDFNKSPGCAATVQEQIRGTCIIDEEWKDSDSNTEIIAKRIVAKWNPIFEREWATRRDRVIKVHGDASGGAGGTSSVRGSDWDLIREIFKAAWGSRVRMLYGKDNPRVAVRVNAVNRRLQDAAGNRRLFVDPSRCPHVVYDLEGVTWEDLEKKRSQKKARSSLTHISDALGYYIERSFGIGGPRVFEG